MGSVADAPAARVAMLVWRHRRILPSADGTTIDVVLPSLTRNNCPVRPCSGRPPSLGGLNRASRQVPVQVVAAGSIIASAWVSLYDTSVRCGVFEPSALGSQRVFQYTSLPLRNAR